MTDISKGVKVIIVLALVIVAIPFFQVIYYFNFVYYSEEYKKDICEELTTGIESIEIVIVKHQGKHNKKNLVLDDALFLKKIHSRLEKVCKASYNKYLAARYSDTILKCRIKGGGADDLYLRVVKLNSGESFVEIHQGGLFSLVGGMEDNHGYVDS